MSFQGEFQNSIDQKGRASIPAKFRDVLAETYGDDCLVVTKNTDGGLSAYPGSRWKVIVEGVEAMKAGPEKSALLRVFVAPAAECAFDKQGRIQIPASLRNHASLERDAVVVGLFDKIEIYSQAMYDEATRRSAELLQANPQVAADLGF